MYKVLLIIISCSTFSCGPSYKLTRTTEPVTAKDDVWNTSNIASFEKALEALRKRYHIPSIAIGIVNEKKLVVGVLWVMLI